MLIDGNVAQYTGHGGTADILGCQYTNIWNKSIVRRYEALSSACNTDRKFDSDHPLIISRLISSVYRVNLKEWHWLFCIIKYLYCCIFVKQGVIMFQSTLNLWDLFKIFFHHQVFCIPYSRLKDTLSQKHSLSISLFHNWQEVNKNKIIICLVLKENTLFSSSSYKNLIICFCGFIFQISPHNNNASAFYFNPNCVSMML